MSCPVRPINSRIDIVLITPENLSTERLRKAFVEADVTSAQIDENGCLQLRFHDQTFIVAVIGPHQVRFLRPSAVTPSEQDESILLKIANDLTSDLAFAAAAYVSEGGNLVFSHAITVSGGVSELNVVMALHEFAVETAIFDQLVEKASGQEDA